MNMSREQIERLLSLSDDDPELQAEAYATGMDVSHFQAYLSLKLAGDRASQERPGLPCDNQKPTKNPRLRKFLRVTVNIGFVVCLALALLFFQLSIDLSDEIDALEAKVETLETENETLRIQYGAIRPTVPFDSDDQSELVYVSASGSKYHSNPQCSNMKNPIKMTESEAVSDGYTPCKNCW